MKLIGLDNGYNYTKTSEGISILSTVKKGIDYINKETLQARIGDIDYIVGDNDGSYVADADKLQNEDTKEVLKVCTLTAIGMSFPDETFIDIEVVAGLPVDYFSKQKDEFKKTLESYNEKVFINSVGKEQTIRIKSATIYPQSAGVVFSKVKEVKNETSLIIDVGGGTWDISQFDGLKMVNKRSYQEGMLRLYSKIAQELNSRYYTKYGVSDIYALEERGHFSVSGERKPISEMDYIIKEHVYRVITNIKRDFDTVNVDNIFLIGGGASVLEEYIVNEFPNAILEENSRFTNANCFELMGRMKK